VSVTPAAMKAISYWLDGDARPKIFIGLDTGGR
jgi:hypothetical protein